MYVLVNGEIDVLVATDQDEETVILRKVPGEFVGEMSIISRGPRTASLRAVGEVCTLCLKQAPFEKILREGPEIRVALIRALSSYLKKSSQ